MAANIVRFKTEVEDVELGQIDSRLITGAFDEGGVFRYEIATATTDQAIPFSTTTGVTTIQALYIYSTYTISLRQTATTDTALTINANSPFVLSGTSMTAILLSNASGSTAVVTIGVWGT